MSFNLISKIFSYLIVCLSLFYFAALQQTYFPMVLDLDEVDYVNAAKQGIVENALEKKSLSLYHFANLAISKARKTPLDTSGFPSESEDTFLLRHYHSVLPVYFWSFFTASSISVEQYRMRLSGAILALLFIITLVLTCRVILPHPYKSSHEALSLFIAALLCSKIFFGAFSTLNFHSFFLIVFVLYSGLLLRFLLHPDKINAVLLGFGATLLAVTLEAWIFPVSASLLFLFFQIYRRKISIKTLLIACLSFLITSFILYPGFWITLYPVKSWSFYAYRIFFDANKEYEQVNAFTKWKNLFFENWLLCSLAVISLFIGARTIKRNKPAAWIVLILGLVYTLILTPFAISLNYLLPGIGVIIMFSTLALSSVFSENQKSKIILPFFGLLIISATILVTPFANLRADSEVIQSKFNSDITQIENFLQDGKPLLIDGANIIRYYLPNNSDKSLVKDLTLCQTDKLGLCSRDNYQYVNLSEKIETGEYKGVIMRKLISGNKIPLLNKLSEIEKTNLFKIELNEYRCYLMSNSSDIQ